MELLKRALAVVLVAALAIPSAADAQNPNGPVSAGRASEPGSLGNVRLSFDDGRRVNPWDVFGVVATPAHSQPRPGADDAPVIGSSAWRAPVTGAAGARVSTAKGQPAAKKRSGQGAASGVRKGLRIALGVALVVGYFMLMAIASACADNPQGCSRSR